MYLSIVNLQNNSMDNAFPILACFQKFEMCYRLISLTRARKSFQNMLNSILMFVT